MFKLTLKYAVFAVVATVVNLLTQRIMDSIYTGPLTYYVSLFAGTLTGLVVKYILDKRYIFYFVTKSRQEDARKFIIYSVMGVATTAIFWGFQTGFYLLWTENEYAKYIGAVIGLTIGYFTKYQLDKRFVFSKNLDKIESEEIKSNDLL